MGARAKGGIARRDALSGERRKQIAKAAAQARWTKDMPHATHEGVIRIGDIEITCAVLSTGQRVFTQGVFQRRESPTCQRRAKRIHGQKKGPSGDAGW